VIPPSFPADKLVVIEVYTPGGNWSSYPPHKHDTHNPPAESDLDEIYYYRIAQPGGFALQHLYADKNAGGQTVKAGDGDVVLVRNGYHAVVAGPGYDVYYLNFLAGSSRTLAVTEDPQHVWIRSTWKATDPRLPLCASDCFQCRSDPEHRTELKNRTDHPTQDRTQERQWRYPAVGLQPYDQTPDDRTRHYCLPQEPIC
jgi:hypothetical protein